MATHLNNYGKNVTSKSDTLATANKNNRVFNKAPIQREEEPIYANVKAPIQREEEPIYANVKAPIQREEPKKEKPIYVTTIYANVKAPVQRGEEPIYAKIKAPIQREEPKKEKPIYVTTIYDTVKAPVQRGEEPIYAKIKAPVQRGEEPIYAKVKAPVQRGEEPIYDTMKSVKNNKAKELVSNNNVDKDINNTRTKFSLSLLIKSLVNLLKSVFIGQNAKNDILGNSDQKNDVKKSIDEQNIDMIKSLAKDGLMHVMYNNIMDYATSTSHTCNPDILKALIEKNANYNLVCQDGNILLSRLLTTPEYKSIGEMLLENYNVDFKMRNVHGENILCELLACGEYETLLSVINTLPFNTLQELVLQRDCKGENFISKTVTACTAKPDNAYLESISKIAMDCAGLCVNQFANNGINMLEGDGLSSNVQKYANVQNCANRAM